MMASWYYRGCALVLAYTISILTLLAAPVDAAQVTVSSDMGSLVLVRGQASTVTVTIDTVPSFLGFQVSVVGGNGQGSVDNSVLSFIGSNTATFQFTPAVVGTVQIQL